MACFRNVVWSTCAALQPKHFNKLARKVSSTSAYGKVRHEIGSADYEDFYRYTSGRWLWAEEERLRERYKRFNVPGLKQIAANVVGAQSCVSMTKLAEGGFNKVFRLCMDNRAVVIARIPNPNVGPASRVLASEVATMDFVQNVLGIPVPKVLGWNGTESNLANAEYILMEEAKGTQLEELWSDMDLSDKFKVVDDVIAIQKKLQSITFSRFGCPKAVPGSASDDLESGPDARSYLRGISQRERSKLACTETNASSPACKSDSEVLDLPQARLSILDKFDAVSAYLPPSDPRLNKATLSHWDLRTPNIFVEDGRITSLIDWQDTWVGPLFMQERCPQLIEYHGETMLRLPDYYETIEDKEEKAKVTDQVERSTLCWYYGQETREKNPTLQRLFDLPLARIRREVVLFASDAWEGETFPLRECLYQVQRQWDKLDTGISCPINFTSEEIEAHDRVASDWNKYVDFWASLNGFVSGDGYTSGENYEQARKMFEEVREEVLTQLSGDELSDVEEQTRWAKRKN